MDGVITRRDLTEGIARAFVWGAFIAAVPVAIWGSILKAKSKREPLDTPPTAPHSVASTSPTSQPSPPELTSLEPPTIQNRQIAREPQPKSLIMKPEPEGKPADDTTMDDEAFYEQVAGEIESDTMKSGLWTKAFAEAEGDHDRAKAFYIRLRVAQLVSARKAELEDLRRLKTERVIEEEHAKRKAIAREEAEKEAAKLQREQRESDQKEANQKAARERELQIQQRAEEWAAAEERKRKKRLELRESLRAERKLKMQNAQDFIASNRMKLATFIVTTVILVPFALYGLSSGSMVVGSVSCLPIVLAYGFEFALFWGKWDRKALKPLQSIHHDSDEDLVD